MRACREYVVRVRRNAPSSAAASLGTTEITDTSPNSADAQAPVLASVLRRSTFTAQVPNWPAIPCPLLRPVASDQIWRGR